MTRAEITELLAIIAAAWPGGHFAGRTVDVYRNMLADLDYPAAQAAVSRLITTSRFLPTVAEIRSAAVDVTQGPRRLGGEAWGDVVAEIRRVGYVGEPRFDDPCVTECVKALGWRHLCIGEAPEASDRARFSELYDRLQERRRLDAVAGHALPPARGHAALPAKRQENREALAQLTGAVGRRMT